MSGRQSSQPASGVYAALVTPRKPSSSEADTGILLDYIDNVEAGGVAGLVLFGSTGEFVHFDLEERARVAGLAVRRCRTPLLVNVSHSDFAGVIALAESAIHSGAAGIAVMPPYFYRYDGASIEAFYNAIADFFAAQIPVYLYNLPQYTSPIPEDSALRLLASGRFAGIKDSSGDGQMLEVLLKLRKERKFQLLAGNEAIYRRARMAGADGAISGVAAALPELITALDDRVLSGKLDDAEQLDARVSEYLAWLERFPATFIIRQTAALRGWIAVPPGLPLSPAQESSLEQFRAWFSGWHAETAALIRRLQS